MKISLGDSNSILEIILYCLAGLIFSLSLSSYCQAHSGVHHSLPAGPDIENARIFGRALRRAGLTYMTTDDRYVTFIIPTDKSCEEIYNKKYPMLENKESARSFVYGHTVVGDLRVNAMPGQELNLAYTTDIGTPSEHREGVRGDNSNLVVSLLNGKRVSVYIRGNSVYIGDISAGVIRERIFFPKKISKIQINKCKPSL